MDYPEDGGDYVEAEQAYAPGGEDDDAEIEIEDEEAPLNMVSIERSRDRYIEVRAKA